MEDIMESCSLYDTGRLDAFPSFQPTTTTSITTSPKQVTRNTIYAPLPSQATQQVVPTTETGRRLSWPRPNRRSSYRMGLQTESEEDAIQESVDLLRMLPESQHKDAPSGTLTTPSHTANSASNTLRAAPSSVARSRLFKEDESEDSSGLYDDAVLYYNSLCGPHGNHEPERIAFLSRSYSALDRKRQNNASAAQNENNRSRTLDVAEYCTSKTHSKSCGSLTCPRFEKNKMARSVKQVYPEHKSKRKKQMRRFKRWVFITAILLGIVLAITGIVVAFLVFAPFRVGVHQCKVGYIWCGNKGCISPHQICSKRKECPGIVQELLCHANRTDLRDPGKSTVSPFTLSPLLRNNDEQYEPDTAGWVHFSGGSPNGSRYITISKAFTFSGAQDACRDQGGHLAHVTNIREQVFLQEFLDREIKKNTFPRGTIGFWIGARRARGSHSGSCWYNQWKWVDFYGREHGSVSGFAAFVPGKPDNDYEPEECLYLSINNGYHESRYLKWDDAPCDIHGIGSIMAVCEVELNH